MLPLSHLLLFVPFSLLVSLVAVAVAVEGLAGLGPQRRSSSEAAPLPSASEQPAPRESAQIITFRPRKTSLPSTFSAGVRQRAR